MAKVWAVYEGREPTIGGPWAELPLEDAVRLLELRQDDFVSDPSKTPRFGDADRDLTYAGYKHIVVEVGRGEAQRTRWKPGFYRSKVSPDDAFVRLVRQALDTELGRNSVVRVEFTPGTDSTGREALRIRVVLAPDAARKFPQGAALNALVKLDLLMRLQEHLRDMREERTPIIEYVTEAELVSEDGGR